MILARREVCFPPDSVEATRPNFTKLKRITHRQLGKTSLLVLVICMISIYWSSIATYFFHTAEQVVLGANTKYVVSSLLAGFRIDANDRSNNSVHGCR